MGTTGRRVLFFFPHNPLPPRAGSHLRCVSVLRALAELGCKVTLFGSTALSNTPWHTPELLAFGRRYGIATELHRLTPFDLPLGRVLKRLYRARWVNTPVSPRLPCPFRMRERFGQAAQRRDPDVIWMNYVCWDGLLDGLSEHSTRPRVVDTHDLVTLNMQMQRLLGAELARLRHAPDRIPESPILREDYFGQYGLCACPAEFDILDRYDDTIVLSPEDEEVIRRNTARTRVRTIPMCQEAVGLGNTYTDPPVMPLGSHMFNLQGLLYFAHRVVPRILHRCPTFACRVTGPLGADPLFPRVACLTRLGFVPDLSVVLRGAAYAVCPAFGGTGQPVKIVEAMAHGLAVVAPRGPAASTPLRHGVSGFVAADAAEFAEHCLRLGSDRGLCRRMGEAARAAVASQYPPGRLLEGVADVLTNAG
ncbi:glycosyltransferase family 4 protein [bacterium]|nr:glycosyltransferase family 4 protein [bacterium]